MSFSGTFVIAFVVVTGSFGYFIFRGGGDPVVMPMIGAALGTVLSFFFAQHISNGAATTAVAAAMETNRATQTAIDHAISAAQGAPPK